MAEEKPVTMPDWVKQLREDIKKDVDNTVHNQLTEFYAEYIKPELQDMDNRNQQQFQEVKNQIQQLKEGQERLEAGQSHIRDDIKGLEAELAATPTRREVEELKTRVDHLERAN